MVTWRHEVIFTPDEVADIHRKAEDREAFKYGISPNADFKRDPLGDGGLRYSQGKEQDHPVWSKIK